MKPNRLTSSTFRGRATRIGGAASALIAVLFIGAVSAGCGDRDLEENFALWSNNSQGWAEIGKFIESKDNDPAQRARALEVLISSGQPNQAVNLIGKHLKDSKDRDKVLKILIAKLETHLKGPNPKLQQHAKSVLFGTMKLQSDAQATATRKMLGNWAFGDMSHDDSTSSIKTKLEGRIRLEELAKLGDHGVKGAEVMLGKGLAKNQLLVMLQSQKSEAAKRALINGLRRYHKGKKNVKVTEGELGFVQRTFTTKPVVFDGLLYLLELYERLSKSSHTADKAAASLAVAASMDWMGNPEGAKAIKANYKKLKPFVDRFLIRDVCDDRWWGVQQLVTHEGLSGLKRGLMGLADDLRYGDPDFADSDVKLMITDICREDVGGKLGYAKARPVFKALLEENPQGDADRFVRRIVSIRCLGADASPEARAILAAFVKARKRVRGQKIIDPLVVPQHGQDLTMTDLARNALDLIDYKTDLDKLVKAKKLSAKQAKLRKRYADYSFDRKKKDIAAFAEDRAKKKK